jgi:hypothetical protein
MTPVSGGAVERLATFTASCPARIDDEQRPTGFIAAQRGDLLHHLLVDPSRPAVDDRDVHGGCGRSREPDGQSGVFLQKKK